MSYIKGIDKIRLISAVEILNQGRTVENSVSTGCSIPPAVEIVDSISVLDCNSSEPGTDGGIVGCKIILGIKGNIDGISFGTAGVGHADAISSICIHCKR